MAVINMDPLELNKGYSSHQQTERDSLRHFDLQLWAATSNNGSERIPVSPADSVTHEFVAKMTVTKHNITTIAPGNRAMLYTGSIAHETMIKDIFIISRSQQSADDDTTTVPESEVVPSLDSDDINDEDESSLTDRFSIYLLHQAISK